jgi:hypothetical protein
MAHEGRDPADWGAMARRDAADPERGEATRLQRVISEDCPDGQDETAWGVARAEAQRRLEEWQGEQLAKKRRRRSEAPEGAQETQGGA